ncbi:hypothetical protein [Deinococcus sonorensis]|uniref:GAF domain-containing protein n=2 Tax=Deinococcus sonorensis TaxID=309891 RepID=A0AAU7UBX4_9DEIO
MNGARPTTSAAEQAGQRVTEALYAALDVHVSRLLLLTPAGVSTLHNCADERWAPRLEPLLLDGRQLQQISRRGGATFADKWLHRPAVWAPLVQAGAQAVALVPLAAAPAPVLLSLLVSFEPGHRWTAVERQVVGELYGTVQDGRTASALQSLSSAASARPAP